MAGARALELLEETALGLVLRPRGRALSASPPDSEGEREAFAKAIRESKAMRLIAPGLLGTPAPTHDFLSRHLRKVGGLSESTARHRAAMLLKWRRTLLDPQTRLPRSAQRGMWRRIDIKNFRSIEQATVELAPFTIVVGPNGSGKSNFADALAFARDIARDADAALTIRGGITGVRRWRPSKPTDVSIEVRAASRQNLLDETYACHYFKIHSLKSPEWAFSEERIDVVQDRDPKAWVHRKDHRVEAQPPVFDRPTKTSSAMVLAKQTKAFARTSPLRNVKSYRLNPDEMRRVQLATEETRLSESGANIAGAIRAIRSADELSAILEPMKKIIPELTDITVDQAGRYLVLKFKQGQGGTDVAEFGASEMSEGALRALGIIVAAHQMEADELLIVEEPEVSIHVGAAGLLFDVLKHASQRGSVLVTTHSADLLDRAEDEEILVCEYANGKTQIGPLAKSQRTLVRKGLFSLAEIMRAEPLRMEPAVPGKHRGKRAS